MMKRNKSSKDKRNSYIPITFGLLLIALMSAVIYVTLLRPSKSEAAWFNDNWLYRTIYTVSNTGSAITSERKIKLDVDTATLITAGKVQSDCDDIRFTDQNGKLLDYFIDTNTADCNNASTDLYVKMPSVISGAFSIYMYYGNSTAVRGDIGGRKNDFFADGTTGVGLKGYWKMDETTANTCTGGANDSCDSALTNDGAWNGNATYTASGKVSGATTYDGTGDYVNAGDILENAVMSWGTWFNATSFANSGILTKRDDATEYSQYTIAVGSGSLFCLQTSTGGAWETLVNVAVPSVASWHHVMCTNNGSIVRMYLDGIEVGTPDSSPATSLSASSESLKFGYGRVANSDVYFPGQIDDVRIYGKALTATEISSIYNSGNGTTINVPLTFTPASSSAGSEQKSPGPVASWSFDEGTGQTTQDKTANNNDGTLGASSAVASDDPTWQSEDMCVSGKCLKFDGSNDFVNVANTVSTVQTVEMWVKPTSTTASLITLNGSASISASSGTISATGFTSPTIYVNGRVISTLSANAWQYIAVTTGTGISASTIKIGNVSSSYLTGFIDEVKIYPYARTALEIKQDYIARGSVHGVSAQMGDDDMSKKLSDGLVGYWKMDESSWNGTASEVVDASGNGNHGTGAGGVSTSGGKYGNGGSFDGVNDYVSLGTSSSLKPINVSVSAWAKTTNDAQYKIIFENQEPSPFQGVVLSVMSNEKVSLQVYTSAYDETISNEAVSITGWTHIVATYDGSNKRIFINGVLDISESQSGNITYGSAASLIGYTASTTYNGSLDEVRIYNRALSPAEVRGLYEFAPGPRVQLKMDDGSGSSAQDSSGNARTGTLNNNSTWDIGKFGKGIKLDGTDDSVSVGDF